MTPAGLSACGSVRWTASVSAAAVGTTIDKANATNAPAIHAHLMDGTVDPPMSVDVSKSLLLGEPARIPIARASEEGERERSIWPVIGPTVLVLALLVLATVYSGAFDVDQWAPPTLFILVLLLTLVLLGGAARLPDRWGGLALGG